MAYVLIRHRVEDYESWKRVFDEVIEMRREGGEKAWQIFYPDGEPNNLVLLFEWDTLDNARAFFSNPALRETMERAGVKEMPDAYFMGEHDRGTV